MIIKKPQKVTPDNLLSFLETKFREFTWKSSFPESSPERQVEFEISQGDYYFFLSVYYDESLASVYDELGCDEKLSRSKKRLVFYYKYKDLQTTEKRKVRKDKKEWVEEAGEVSIYITENNYARANHLLNKIQKHILDKEMKIRKEQEEVYLHNMLQKMEEFLS